MGSGLVIIFLLLVIAIPAFLFGVIRYKNGFASSFWKSYIFILLSIIVYFCLNHIHGYFGKKSGGFADSWYLEIKNNYFLEFIDTLENASLTYRNENIFTQNLHTGDTFKFALNNDNIVIIDSNNTSKSFVIDTQLKTITQEKLNLDNLVFLTPEEYYIQETQSIEYILLKIFLGILSLLITIGLFKSFAKKEI